MIHFRSHNDYRFLRKFAYKLLSKEFRCVIKNIRHVGFFLKEINWEVKISRYIYSKKKYISILWIGTPAFFSTNKHKWIFIKTLIRRIPIYSSNNFKASKQKILYCYSIVNRWWFWRINTFFIPTYVQRV